MSQVQVTLTFASLELATAFFAKADGAASAPAAIVSTDKAPPPKSAPTPSTKPADVKPTAEKPKEKPPAAAPATPATASDAPTLQAVSDAINAALKAGAQNRPKVVAVLAEFQTADGVPVTNAKVMQAKDYAEFLLKLGITLDPGAAANGDLT